MKGVFIVPYRNRFEHRCEFVLHMRTNYPEIPIKIIEQADDKPFNRGKLLNIGFLLNDYDYYIFHDVDMIPENVDYSEPRGRPLHLATEVEQFNYTMPYPEYFGGVVLFTKQQFSFINGYTNLLYGWGLEDDVMRRDLHWKGIKIDRKKARFRSLYHEPNGNKYSDQYKANEKLLRGGRPKEDGLKHCIYELLERTDYGDYELIKVVL